MSNPFSLNDERGRVKGESEEEIKIQAGEARRNEERGQKRD
jgi:hypothetical protein